MLDILALLMGIFYFGKQNSSANISQFLCVDPVEVDLVLASLVSITRYESKDSSVHISHASLSDFLSDKKRAEGKGSVQCVREVREVHALSLTITHLKYWLTHFCNNLKPDGSEAESPMASWAPHFVKWSALVEIHAFSCVNCYWMYHVSRCTQCARAFQRS